MHQQTPLAIVKAEKTPQPEGTTDSHRADPTAAAEVPPVGQLSTARGKKVAPFLAQLWAILADKTNMDIVRWSSNGTTVEVLSRARLLSEVIPKYFKSTRFASFQRQLCYFGFEKVNSSMSEVAYSNPKLMQLSVPQW